MPDNEEPTQVMAVRVPRYIYNDIHKLKKEMNLSSLGTAITLMIEDAKNEQLETRLIKMEEGQRNLTKSNQELVHALHKILPNLTLQIVHNEILNLVNQRQIQKKLPLDKESLEDTYGLYLYKERLMRAQKQFEGLKHTDCHGYEWVVKEINRLIKKGKDKKTGRKTAESREHVR